MKIGGNKFELRTVGRTALRRLVEKPQAASILREEAPHELAPSMPRTERRRLGRASRYGTNFSGGADRRGTESRFVAQVLGQILGPSQDNTLLAARAYERNARERKETRLVQVL